MFCFDFQHNQQSVRNDYPKGCNDSTNEAAHNVARGHVGEQPANMVRNAESVRTAEYFNQNRDDLVRKRPVGSFGIANDRFY